MHFVFQYLNCISPGVHVTSVVWRGGDMNGSFVGKCLAIAAPSGCNNTINASVHLAAGNSDQTDLGPIASAHRLTDLGPIASAHALIDLGPIASARLGAYSLVPCTWLCWISWLAIALAGHIQSSIGTFLFDCCQAKWGLKSATRAWRHWRRHSLDSPCVTITLSCSQSHGFTPLTKSKTLCHRRSRSCEN